MEVKTISACDSFAETKNNNSSIILSEPLAAFERVKIARSKNRATCSDYLKLFDNFIEMHGDRCFGDDQAIIGGIAYFENRPITVIGIERGKDTKEKIKRNFGSAHPEGYRKALRLMKQADKFKRPIICFIDTSGAYCGLEAEERGQGQAIANNLAEMMKLGVPILSIVIGEGGSGGALALAVANEVYMLENSIYSVISPEGCASILFKDVSKAAEACNNLKCTSFDLLDLRIIEQIIPEDEKMMASVKASINGFLLKYEMLSASKIINQRYEKFRKIGG